MMSQIKTPAKEKKKTVKMAQVGLKPKKNTNSIAKIKEAKPVKKDKKVKSSAVQNQSILSMLANLKDGKETAKSNGAEAGSKDGEVQEVEIVPSETATYVIEPESEITTFKVAPKGHLLVVEGLESCGNIQNQSGQGD